MMGRAALLCGTVAGVGAAPGDPPTVSIPGVGTITGAASAGSPGVNAFKGIPYAAPPVGDLRWMDPAPAVAWNATRDGTRFGAACVGAGDGCHEDSVDPAPSEDCLFLNVFAPSAPVGAKRLPVMVWIHGGGYTDGCSDIYVADRLVAKSNHALVLVTVNYRLNVFGFSGAAELAAGGTGTGNYGIADQRAALGWVRDHIGAFGGDGADVTIFGESAGGHSMMNHLTQPASFPLYKKVIIESGTYHGATAMQAAQKSWDKLLKALKCSDASCARAASAADVEKAGGGSWGPVIDGVNLQEAPYKIVEAGKHNTAVPVMLGSNRDELSMVFVVPGKYAANLTELEFDVVAAGAARGHVAEVKQLYAADAYPYPANLGMYSHWWWAAMRVATDSDASLGACSVRRAATGFARAGNPGVWSYLYAHPPQTAWIGRAKGQIPGIFPGTVVAPHASEIPFVFNCGSGDPSDCSFATTDEQALSDAMTGYWTRFAISGDPNGAGAPKWEEFTADGDANIRFETESESGIKMQTGLRKAACDFWDQR